MGLTRELVKSGLARDSAEGVVKALKTDPESAELSSTDRVMVEYSIKLTRDPGNIRGEDVAALRNVGFSDRAIHDLCAIVGYFAFVNRIADGLGVELESTD